ncbi:MAG: methionyl-tRNA formyltransferase [Clostridiales bacterium]|nr:methionyl-tRNA formyltransferase [Clostridiales bacterium]
MKIIYMGTPQFAVPCLRALADSRHEVVAVITQPDKATGRSNKLQESPVKMLAKEYGYDIYQFNKIRLEGVDTIKELDADIIVTCAYGQILNKEILYAKKYGVINVHGSILPRYRGASPIQSAIINGDKTTGITILQSGIGIDDGPIITTSELQILDNETYGELSDRLSHLGAETLLRALDMIENGTAKMIEQDETMATHCTMFKSDYGKINFNNNAKDIVNMIHGLNPSPVAFTYINDNRYKLYNAHIVEECEVSQILANLDANPGDVVVAKSKAGLIIKARDKYVSIDRLQAENGKILEAKDLLNSGKIKVGDRAFCE